MRFRVIFALAVTLIIGTGIVLAESLIRRPVSFQVLAQTEVIEGRISPVSADDSLVFQVVDAQICDGDDFFATADEPGSRCRGFIRMQEVAAGEVIIQRAVDARVLRRGQGDMVVELSAGDAAEPTESCDGGIVARLDTSRSDSTSQAIPLCSSVRISMSGRSLEMPRLTLRGHDARIGQAFGENPLVGTPSMIAGSVTMWSSSMLRDVGLVTSGLDFGPDRFAINLGDRELHFGESFSACDEATRCGNEADEPAPFSANIAAHPSAGLIVHAHLVGVAGIVDSYGRRGDLVKPRWFARLINDPDIGWLYAVGAFLVGLLLKVDKWLFRRVSPGR